MFLVLNGMGIKDKLGPLALQPVTYTRFFYTRFFSLSSDLLINGFSLGLRKPACNMQMRDKSGISEHEQHWPLKGLARLAVCSSSGLEGVSGGN